MLNKNDNHDFPYRVHLKAVFLTKAAVLWELMSYPMQSEQD